MKRRGLNAIREGMLRSLHALQVMYPQRIPASEQVLLMIVLSPDQKLIRDRWGRWSHASLLKDITANDAPAKGFNGGFKDRTITHLVELGRLRETKFNDAGRAVEVEWVRL